MKTVLPWILAPVLALLLVVALLLGFEGSLSHWIILLVLIGLALAGFHWWSLGIPKSSARVGLLVWWWVCSMGGLRVGLEAQPKFELSVMNYPGEVEDKLEAYRQRVGHYPENLGVVDPFDLRRFHVQYRSNGRLYEFTILKHTTTPPELWIYDGTTRVWAREK